MNAKGDHIVSTADADDHWSKGVKLRVRRVISEADEQKEDWRYENDQPAEWLFVEHYKNIAQSEDARSVSWPQELAEHQSCAERKAPLIAERIGLSAVQHPVDVADRALHPRRTRLGLAAILLVIGVMDLRTMTAARVAITAETPDPGG